MATLVRFLKDGENGVFAYFPQLNYNKHLYGNTMKTGYAHIGQHSAVAVGYATDQKECQEAEYLPLASELTSIGYNLKILNK
jgi:hypothetical protein